MPRGLRLLLEVLLLVLAIVALMALAARFKPLLGAGVRPCLLLLHPVVLLLLGTTFLLWRWSRTPRK